MPLSELVPKDKFDLATAERLFAYRPEQIRPIIPQLLEWLQDMNWPVAGPVSRYLKSIASHISTEIIEVLKGQDDVWKYWILNVFGLEREGSIAPELMQEIQRIATHPTEGEIEEEVSLIAQEILESLTF